MGRRRGDQLPADLGKFGAAGHTQTGTLEPQPQHLRGAIGRQTGDRGLRQRCVCLYVGKRWGLAAIRRASAQVLVGLRQYQAAGRQIAFCLAPRQIGLCLEAADDIESTLNTCRVPQQRLRQLAPDPVARIAHVLVAGIVDPVDAMLAGEA